MSKKSVSTLILAHSSTLLLLLLVSNILLFNKFGKKNLTIDQRFVIMDNWAFVNYVILNIECIRFFNVNKIVAFNITCPTMMKQVIFKAIVDFQLVVIVLSFWWPQCIS